MAYNLHEAFDPAFQDLALLFQLGALWDVGQLSAPARLLQFHQLAVRRLDRRGDVPHEPGSRLRGNEHHGLPPQRERPGELVVDDQRPEGVLGGGGGGGPLLAVRHQHEFVHHRRFLLLLLLTDDAALALGGVAVCGGGGRRNVVALGEGPQVLHQLRSPKAAPRIDLLRRRLGARDLLRRRRRHAAAGRLLLVAQVKLGEGLQVVHERGPAEASAHDDGRSADLTGRRPALIVEVKLTPDWFRLLASDAAVAGFSLLVGRSDRPLWSRRPCMVDEPQPGFALLGRLLPPCGGWRRRRQLRRRASYAITVIVVAGRRRRRDLRRAGHHRQSADLSALLW